MRMLPIALTLLFFIAMGCARQGSGPVASAPTKPAQIASPEAPPIRALFPATTAEAISEFERKCDRQLPSDYKQFLLRTNGARILGLCVPIRERWKNSHSRQPAIYPPFEWPPKEDPIRDLIAEPSTLLGISVLNENNVLKTSNPAYRFNEQLPSSLLLIGFTHLTDVICLGTAGEYRGKVYLWSSTLRDPEVSPEEAREGLELLADSFAQFWDDLKPSPENEPF